MKKHWDRVLLGLGILALLFGVGTRIASPVAKTTFYFTLRREWAAHWPWDRGRLLPVALSPWLGPFVPVWTHVEPHVTMRLDPADLVSEIILERGSWEPESWHAVAQHLAPGATFVDVGAHIGYYSLMAAPIVGPAGRVIAIEPNPQTLPKLRDNLRASGANVVSVEPFACSNAEATLELFAAPGFNTGESSLSRANASQDGPAVAAYRVRARPLDDILAEARVSRVDAIKIDVEGAEMSVLQGARATLDRYHPMILVELIDRQLQAMGASSAAVRSFLQARGYAATHEFGANVEFDVPH